MHLLFLLTTSIYPLIGAPAVGKTSIIEVLQKDEITVRETATDLIAEYMAKGENTPWQLPGFEIEIIQEKIRREEKALCQAKKEKKKHIYVDRGLLDNLVYLKVNHKENTKEYRKIEKKLQKAKAFDRYHTVFFVEPYNGNQYQANQSGVRHEDTKQALELGEQIKEIYEKYYNVVSVPPHMTPAERALFIKNKVREFANSKLFVASKG